MIKRSMVKYDQYLGHYVTMPDGSWYAVRMLDMINQTFYMESGNPRYIWTIEVHGHWKSEDFSQVYK